MNLLHHTAPARAILPDDLRVFYAQARAVTYAASSAPAVRPALPHSKELPWPQPPWYYVDRYFDTPDRPGNFVGLEVISRDRLDGPVVASCSYGGGFTDEGLALAPGADIGAVLKAALHDFAATVRFGEALAAELRTEAGLWRYEDAGEVTPWGWAGTERIWLDEMLVYSLGYQGACFLAGH